MTKNTTTTNAGPATQGQTKLVDYSYPTSPNAKKHGFGSVGCYTVSVATGHAPARAVQAFADKNAAFAFARTLPMPFHKFQTF